MKGPPKAISAGSRPPAALRSRRSAKTTLLPAMGAPAGTRSSARPRGAVHKVISPSVGP